MRGVRIVPGIRKSFPLRWPSSLLCWDVELVSCFSLYTHTDYRFYRAKKKKYPDGYPGDAPSSDTSKPVKYSCHKCMKTFPSVPHPDSQAGLDLKASIEKGEKEQQECSRCKHTMCTECSRAPPRKEEPELDPEVVERVREKLAGLGVASTGVVGVEG